MFSQFNNLFAAKESSKNKPEDTHVYWVDVTIDNTQKQIPHDSDEITIRKSYNCNSDTEKYYINGEFIA